MTARSPGFFVAPFAIDGELAGLAHWEPAALSAEWLGVCDEHLGQYGLCFDASWKGRLSHIRTKLTSASGAALATFWAGGRLALSLLFASGHAPEAESELMDLFTQSLRRMPMVSAAADSSEPFRAVRAIKERPLMIVVPWPDEAISDADHELVQQLATHMAATFFARELLVASSSTL
jgi:hypothetical protein